MSTYYVKYKYNTVWGFDNLANIYHFEGITFEMHSYFGPQRCRKNGELCKRQPGDRSKTFWKTIEKWEKLSPAKKEKTRIYG